MENTGSKSWCEALYDAKAASLILYGRALGLTHSEAEDTVQETFIALLQLQETPNEPEHYLLRSFRNKALNLHRSLWRRLAREMEFYQRRWFERHEGESPRERAAMKCLSELPSDQREVIVLKLWHHHTFEEIGQLIAVSPHTVAGRYRYGIQKMKSCLRELNYEHEPWPALGDDPAILDSTPPVQGT